MYCKYCGEQISDNNKFCTNCGKSNDGYKMAVDSSKQAAHLNKTNYSSSPDNMANEYFVQTIQNQENGSPVKTKKAGKVGVLIAVIFAGLLLIAATLTYFLYLMPLNRYNQALAYYDKGDYKAAAYIFEDLKEFKDAPKRYADCIYENAKVLINEGNYDQAIESLNDINHKGKQELLNTANYNNAVKLAEDKKYDEAIELFRELGDYADSADQIKTIEMLQKIKDLRVGDSIYFGKYEQDNNVQNGEEDIEWRVLAIEDNKALIISRYAFVCHEYNTSFTSITWEDCSLRSWLNSFFYDAAFDAMEKNVIATSTVKAERNPSFNTPPGNSTTDKVFILSIAEANRYFTSNSDRRCQGTPYYYAQGAFRYDDGYCPWRLRTPGNITERSSGVNGNGLLNYGGFDVRDYHVAIRPVMWIYTD